MAQNRFYIDTQGNDYEAYKEAIAVACELAKKYPEIKRGILLIGQKGHDGWFQHLYGDAAVKKLYDGAKFKGCDLTFKFETVRTYSNQYGSPEDVLISCGLSSKDLFKFDNYYGVHSLIAIPWLKQSTQEWIDTWKPLNLRGKAEAGDEQVDVSCVVQQAMGDLTNSINMSTGITHPADNDLAKTYILALHHHGELNDSIALRRYLVKNKGWDARSAKEVSDLVDILNSGKHFKGGTRTKASWKYHVQRWQEACQE